MKSISIIILITTFSFSEIIVEKQSAILEEAKVIKINKKEPPKPIVENKEKNTTVNDCSFYNPLDCIQNKYSEYMDSNKSISEVIIGPDEGGGVEEIEKEDTRGVFEQVGDGVSAGGTYVWTGTKNILKSAGSATSGFVKRKFDETWEESKREVARQKAERKQKALERKKAQGR